MRSPSSSDVTRAIRALAAGLPGTTAAAPFFRVRTALSRWSRRSPALRWPSSGPWQAKQFFERIGLTSRLKSTGGAANAASGASHTRKEQTNGERDIGGLRARTEQAGICVSYL